MNGGLGISPPPFLVFYGGTMTKLDEPVSGQAAMDEADPTDQGARLIRAFNELRDELISTLVYVLGNREDAKDAAQEAFIKCWNAREQLGQIVNLRAWIFRVCFNTAKDMQRSAWNRKAKPLKAEQYTMMAKELA